MEALDPVELLDCATAVATRAERVSALYCIVSKCRISQRASVGTIDIEISGCEW